MWQLRFWTYFLLLALSLAPVQRVVACSCLMTHPQKIFCSSNFVILAKVKGIENSGDVITYHIKIRRVFKAAYDELLTFVNMNVVQTPASPGLCGVQLNIGEMYVLSGGISAQGILRIGLCSMPTEWRTVSRSQRKAYKKLYIHGCSCEIQHTGWKTKGNALDNTRGKVCLLESAPGPESCQRDFGVCMPISGGCSWFHTVAYKCCIKEYQEKRERAFYDGHRIDYKIF